MNKIKRDFFRRPTLEVAENLLGKFLIKENCVGQIYEVEAYVGDIDPACHAFGGVTERTKVRFGDPGFSYVYFVYGMFYCFNVVTEDPGRGCAVLIRSVKPINGIDVMLERRNGRLNNLADGPGKLCIAFDIDKRHNGLDLCNSDLFYLADNGYLPESIEKSKRIGISKATDLEWRFSCKL